MLCDPQTHLPPHSEWKNLPEEQKQVPYIKERAFLHALEGIHTHAWPPPSFRAPESPSSAPLHTPGPTLLCLPSTSTGFLSRASLTHTQCSQTFAPKRQFSSEFKSFLNAILSSSLFFTIRLNTIGYFGDPPTPRVLHSYICVPPLAPRPLLPPGSLAASVLPSPRILFLFSDRVSVCDKLSHTFVSPL